MGKGLKRILIISPHFPPVNTADMHRVRQSLPYLKELGWEPVIITVAEEYIEAYSTDPLLLHTIPDGIEVHKVNAFSTRWTRKFGLGSLSMRAYFQIKRKGNELLKKQKFDLIFFSTTAFHVMALGPGWKKKFGVPFILDIQDPWRSDFYLDKPRSERPPKFFIAYNIDKYLEGKTVPQADGIISVSEGYCKTFLERYTNLQPRQLKVISFGVSLYDFEVMEKFVHNAGKISLPGNKINIVYVGRGGYDLRFALEIIFKAFAKGLQLNQKEFSLLHFWFIGTSYAAPGMGQETIKPLATSLGVGDHVTEVPDRIPYFETLYLLKNANILLIPGSTDTAYTASKVYPYILAQKPLLAVFYKESSVIDVLQNVGVGSIVAFDHSSDLPEAYVDECLAGFQNILEKRNENTTVVMSAFKPYTALAKTAEQVSFFDEVISYRTNNMDGA